MTGPYTVEAGKANWRDIVSLAGNTQWKLLFNGRVFMAYSGWKRPQIDHICSVANIAYFDGVKQCKSNLEDPSGDYAAEWYSGMNTTT